MSLRSGFHYKTESLSEYTEGLASDIPSVSYDITEHLGDKLEYWVKRFTPKATRRLVNSIHAGPVMIGAEPVRVDEWLRTKRGRIRKKQITYHPYSVEVSTDVEYAPWVEYDTGKHGPSGSNYDIPRTRRKGKVLAFYWKKTGRMMYLASVSHPGSKGAGMFRKGSARLTDKYIINQSRPILSKFRARHLVARPWT